jgi:hypothetical protein
MHQRSILLSAALISGAGLAGANGLTAPDGREVWPQWQARITLSTVSLDRVSLSAQPDPRAQRLGLQSGALLGDYYFDLPGLRLPALQGGLRASSGLMIGPRGLALSGSGLLRGGQSFGLAVQGGNLTPFDSGRLDAAPYIGLGYTALAGHGSFRISADLGLVAEHPGGVSGVGRALFGTQGFDSALREMRLSPVLQVGVSYSF